MKQFKAWHTNESSKVIKRLGTISREYIVIAETNDERVAERIADLLNTHGLNMPQNSTILPQKEKL